MEFRSIGFIAVLGSALAIAAEFGGAASASRKFDLIESGRLRPGTRIHFTTAELNDWLREQAQRYFPGAIRNLRLVPGDNSATAYADIDFVKLREDATGEQPGWILRNLFAGERSVMAKAHFVSLNGGARVDLDRVEISGAVIEGRTLDFLIRNYVRPTFPEVKLSEWFRLADGVDKFTTSAAGATVFIGR